MKQILLASLLCAISLTACKTEDKKPCPPVEKKALLTETEEVAAYLKGAGITTATQDPMGYFYTIEKPGSEKKPHACSEVVIDYVGTLTNGTEFDKGADVSFPLDRLILGWQMGMPKIGEGGAITLYLPPSLAYGDEASGEIPSHSILIFKIELHEVKN
jgi:FKBP-type peptidyl-prolyl cis-trans isomerase FkpA